MSDDRHNILLILTDQQRWDSLGCYGVPGVHTPNLDRLAGEGIRYDRCYVNATVCTPSRASLWTGKHVPGHGVHALHDCLPEDEILFPKRLQEAGYRTALFGKLHVSGHLREFERRHPNDGFDVYEWASDPFGPWGMDNAYLDWLSERDPEQRERMRGGSKEAGHIPVEAHLTTWSAERTMAFIADQRGKDQPFFCCMSLFDPHSPYTNYPEEVSELLDVEALPGVVAADQGFEDRPVAHRMEHQWGTRVPESDTLARFRVGYHAAVANIDAQVGRVLAYLDREGMCDSTTVIFTSDHGDMLGDHGLMTKGAYFYDACTRVPMIVRRPGAGRRVQTSPVQLHDIGTTCLRIAGQPADETAAWSPDGISILDDEAVGQRDRAVCLYRNSGSSHRPEDGYRGYFDPEIHGMMWFTGSTKVTVYHSPHNEEHPQGELYNMADDPDECENLWEDSEYHEVRDRVLREALDWLALEDVRGRARGEDASGDRFTR